MDVRCGSYASESGTDVTTGGIVVGRRGSMRDDSAEILFQSFLQEALLSGSGMGRDVWLMGQYVTLPSKMSHIDTFHETLIFTHL